MFPEETDQATATALMAPGVFGWILHLMLYGVSVPLSLRSSRLARLLWRGGPLPAIGLRSSSLPVLTLPLPFS